ncbi:High-affinity gluconate transporter [Planctomycetes bacterium CA13]|uniref:High-affinity gluconate transporter n=1 Tax=Novipirellula herctigrandis TaxID=2527986 RepID=A0A5C5Z8J7_9BACT|nr:High-affinity gluconate transporter [Planctomycetes bacterium CA13]
MKYIALGLVALMLCGTVALASDDSSGRTVISANAISSGAAVEVADELAIGNPVDEKSDSAALFKAITRVFTLVAVLVMLLVAITRWKIHPFLALLISSLLLGPVSGLAPMETVESFLSGFAGTMKWIGVVIVLGALIGELLSQSGGTLKIAHTILDFVGTKRLPLAMGLTGYVVSIPAFVDIAYIMLRPIVEVLAVKSRRNVLVVGLSLAAGLTASHALLPPTPGPLATAAILDADIGRVIMINVVVAAFAVLGGLLWATLYCRNVRLPEDDALRDKLHQSTTEDQCESEASPSFFSAIAPILLPLVLIAVGALLSNEQEDGLAAIVQFLSMPVVALLCGILVGMFLLRRGTRLAKLSGLVEKSIESSAVVLMITAAGGGFGGVIKATGVGDDIAAMFVQSHLPSILFPFLLAATLTTATGSLTVSMVTSSSVVASMLPSLGLSPEFAVALIGAGSLCIIHANSSFFWLLSRLHNIPPDVLYRTYSVQSVCMSLGGLMGAFLLHLFGVT